MRSRPNRSLAALGQTTGTSACKSQAKSWRVCRLGDLSQGTGSAGEQASIATPCRQPAQFKGFMSGARPRRHLQCPYSEQGQNVLGTLHVKD
jgi:hypothetical protein